MAKPNTLIFVDFPSPDPAASARFYSEVFGWECEGRPADVFYRIVPGGHFPLEDGNAIARSATCTWVSTTRRTPRPHPDPAGVEPRQMSSGGRDLRVRGSWLATTISQDRFSTRRNDWAQRSSGATTTGQSSTGTTVHSSIRGATRSFCGPSPATTQPSPKDSPMSEPTTRACPAPSTPAATAPAEIHALDTHRAAVHRLDKTIDWYERFTPLQLLDRREDADGQGAWLGHPDSGDSRSSSFWSASFRDQDKGPQPIMAPFAHIGMEVHQPRRGRRHRRRGEAEGCLAWPPTDMPAPIGYICALKDPDGNMIEFSHNQGVYEKAQEVWGCNR